MTYFSSTTVWFPFSSSTIIFSSSAIRTCGFSRRATYNIEIGLVQLVNETCQSYNGWKWVTEQTSISPFLIEIRTLWDFPLPHRILLHVQKQKLGFVQQVGQMYMRGVGGGVAGWSAHASEQRAWPKTQWCSQGQNLKAKAKAWTPRPRPRPGPSRPRPEVQGQGQGQSSQTVTILHFFAIGVYSGFLYLFLIANNVGYIDLTWSWYLTGLCLLANRIK